MANKNWTDDDPVDSPKRRRLPPLLRRCWYSLNQAFRRRLAHTGISPDQFTILRILLEHEPTGLTQFELATQMSSDPNTVSSLLRRMTEVGLVLRKRVETDRRALQVRISEAGGSTYHEARKLALDLQSALLEKIPEARREQFLLDLDLVATAAAEQAKKGKTLAAGNP